MIHDEVVIILNGNDIRGTEEQTPRDMVNLICGIQGFCMDKSSGAACYWDCDPGWCSCTSGSCFDQEGKCELKASYPESNNWQATCPFY